MYRYNSIVGKTNLASNVRFLLYQYGFGYVWEVHTISYDVLLVNAFKAEDKLLRLQIEDSPTSSIINH